MCNANVVHFNPSCQLYMPAVAVQMNVFRRVTGLLTYQRAIPVTSDGCTSSILHWLAAWVYQKCTLLKVYYIETEKPWKPPGPSGPAFLICKGKASNSTCILLFTQTVFKGTFSSAHWKRKNLVSIETGVTFGSWALKFLFFPVKTKQCNNLGVTG